VIHNGIETECFTRPYDTSAVRAEFDVAPNGHLIGMVGRIDWWKGQEYFVQAVAKVTEKIPDLKALIVGALEETANVYRNRKYMETLQALIKSLHMEDTVILTGARADVPRLMAAMDVVVHASSEPEPFGLVVLEGMAAGKPVVATAAGGVLDIVEDRVTGLLVPPKDYEAMAAAIQELLSDKQFAQIMSTAARKRVVSDFRIQQQTDLVQDVYNSLLNSLT
jgi:glycosyltransferase involved in cell wall biosynthesis